MPRHIVLHANGNPIANVRHRNASHTPMAMSDIRSLRALVLDAKTNRIKPPNAESTIYHYDYYCKLTVFGGKTEIKILHESIALLGH